MKSILPTLLLAALLAACAPASPVTTPQAAVNPESAPVELTVLAASSLTEPFSEIGVLFEAAHPGVKVNFSFAGSQQLAQQISEGAPVDVFASASQKHMDALVSSGQVDAVEQVVFARNRLVVILPRDNPANLQSLADLARPGIKVDLAAAEVPVGKYSLEFLEHASLDPTLGAGYKDAVLANVVSYEDNVKAVLTKVALGEADAGIVYTSDVSGKEDAIQQIAIPEDLNVIASYPIAALNQSARRELAQAFVELVLSPAGQAVLAKYGFIPAE